MIRLVAGIFSAVAFYALLRLLNLAFHIVPMQVSGAEGGLIELGLDMMFGSIAAVIALVLAGIGYRRSRGSKGAKLMLAWCWCLLLAFLLIFLKSVI